MQHIKTKIAFLGVYLALFIPLTAHAAINNLTQLISYLTTTINSIIPLLFGVAIVVFIWGVIKYINADGPIKLAEARNYIIFSIVAIAIMLSVWGIALMIKNTFFEGIASPVGAPGSNSNSSLPASQNTSGSCSGPNDCSAGFVCNNGTCSSGY